MVVRPLVAKHRDDRLMIVLPARDVESRPPRASGELRPSAAISSGALSLRPSSSATTTPCSPRSTLATCDFHSSQMFLPASARAWSAARRWRFSCIKPSGSSSSASKCEPAGLQPVGDRDPRGSGSPGSARWSATPIVSSIRIELDETALVRPSNAALRCAAPGRRDRRRSPTARSNRARTRARGRPARRRR